MNAIDTLSDAEARARLKEIHEVLYDEDINDWRELDSCADAVQDITLILCRPEDTRGAS